MSLVSIMCSQVEVSASGLSLVLRSPSECGVSEYDRDDSVMSRPWLTSGCVSTKKNCDLS